MRRILAALAVAGTLAAGAAVAAGPVQAGQTEAYRFCYRINPDGTCSFSPWRVNKGWPLPAVARSVRF